MTDKLSPSAKSFIALLQRSPDIGAGWRQVSALVWQLVENFDHPELLEIDPETLRVRLSPRGLVVTAYL